MEVGLPERSDWALPMPPPGLRAVEQTHRLLDIIDKRWPAETERVADVCGSLGHWRGGIVFLWSSVRPSHSSSALSSTFPGVSSSS